MLERLRERPGEQPRWRLVVAAVATATVLGVLLVRGGARPTPTVPSTDVGAGAPVISGRAQTAPAAATAAAARFLTRYLPLLYGQAGADGLVALTPRLRRAVAAQRGRVTPAERTRHPRLVGLTFARGDLAQTVVFEAAIDDGASRYRVRLQVARQGQLWRVVRLPDAHVAVGPNGAD